jgi:NADPH:quinone reductase-like Zn-dependent oxidoreductase
LSGGSPQGSGSPSPSTAGRGCRVVRVQIAHAAGARVIATAGPDNQQILKDLGADVALDYRQASVADAALKVAGGAGVDAVFDCVGGATVVESIPATRPFGRMATIAGVQGDLTPLYVKKIRHCTASCLCASGRASTRCRCFWSAVI